MLFSFSHAFGLKHPLYCSGYKQKKLFYPKVSPQKMKEIQAKIDEERRALEAQKGMVEAERNKVAAGLEKRERDLRKAQ